MVIGNGMLAQKFAKYKSDLDIIIFASGVSNSLEKNSLEYLREAELLENIVTQNKDAVLVYFSSCSMYDPSAKETKYVLHKIALENFIQKNVKKYLIFRISQIVGNTTNNTLINYLIKSIKAKNRIAIWKNSMRNLIDIDDVYSIVSYILDNKTEVNKVIHIANSQNMWILDIVKQIENILKISAIYDLEDKGAEYLPIPNDLEKYLFLLSEKFGNDYYLQLFKKYVI